MELHSSQTPRYVMILDALIIVGVLSATLYLFFNRLDFVRTAEAEWSKSKIAEIILEPQGQSISAEPVEPDVPQIEEPAAPAAIQETIEQPDPPAKLPKPVKPAAKPKPPPPAAASSQNSDADSAHRAGGGYQPRNYQAHGFQRRGFNSRSNSNR